MEGNQLRPGRALGRDRCFIHLWFSLKMKMNLGLPSLSPTNRNLTRLDEFLPFYDPNYNMMASDMFSGLKSLLQDLGSLSTMKYVNSEHITLVFMVLILLMTASVWIYVSALWLPSHISNGVLGDMEPKTQGITSSIHHVPVPVYCICMAYSDRSVYHFSSVYFHNSC